MSRYISAAVGPIEDAEGKVIGTHRGLSFYTLGQRSGLGLGGRAGAAEAPWYVAIKDLPRNALVVVQEHDHPLLMSDCFEVEELRWLNGLGSPAANADFDCTVKTRYRQKDLGCRVRYLGGGRAQIRLHHPARAVTPGQYAVFYDGEVCLGGGVIAQPQKARAELDRQVV